MAYALFSDIESNFRNIDFNKANGAINQTKVEQFIVQEEAGINVKISNLYVVPVVTGLDSIEILKKISIDLVSYRVAKILNLKREVPIPNVTNVQDLNYGACYKISLDRLEKISNGELNLPGSEKVSNAGGLSSGNTDNDVGPLFVTDSRLGAPEQW